MALPFVDDIVGKEMDCRTEMWTRDRIHNSIEEQMECRAEVGGLDGNDGKILLEHHCLNGSGRWTLPECRMAETELLQNFNP